MDNRLGHLGIGIMAAFIILIVQLSYLQVVSSDSLEQKPQNIRPLINERNIQRGSIISSDNVLLAESRLGEDGYKRVYPKGSLAAPITGFYSEKYGRAGLELTFDDELAGNVNIASVDDYAKRLLGKAAPGHDLIITIDMSLQAAAQEALGDKKGAIVVLNPKTGAVLAIVSNPSFNPNEVDTNWAKISKDPGSVLLNRATQGRFTPGSSFKVITAAAAIEDEIASVKSTLEAPPVLKVYGGKVTNYEGKDHGNITFETAFIKSVNTVFGQLGVDLGGVRLVNIAQSFGFNRDIPFDIPVSTSGIPSASQMDELEVAWTAVGQGRLQATPLNMALAASAIANDGVIMRPFIVQSIRDYRSQSLFEQAPNFWLRPIEKDTADQVKALMIETVERGTGKRARIDGITVAGKTGTAEVGSKPPHAWFIGFAPADNPEVAVAVIIENGGAGGRIAAPIARNVIRESLVKN